MSSSRDNRRRKVRAQRRLIRWGEKRKARIDKVLSISYHQFFGLRDYTMGWLNEKFDGNPAMVKIADIWVDIVPIISSYVPEMIEYVPPNGSESSATRAFRMYLDWMVKEILEKSFFKDEFDISAFRKTMVQMATGR